MKVSFLKKSQIEFRDYTVEDFLFFYKISESLINLIYFFVGGERRADCDEF